MEIKNRIEHRTISSNIVYPSLDEYKWICKLDEEYVEDMLDLHFGVKRINNKYLIEMPNKQLWYQHDKGTWLVEKNLRIID